MDREYFLGAFVVAAIVGVLIARWFISRVGAWEVLREVEEDRWARLYVLGAVVVVLWVATALVGQLISGATSVTTQVIVSSGNFLENPRLYTYIFSVTAGISTGTQFGIALGLVGYVLRVVTDVGDGESSDGGDASEGGDAEEAVGTGD